MLGYIHEEIQELNNKAVESIDKSINTLDEYKKCIKGIIDSIDKLQNQIKEL